MSDGQWCVGETAVKGRWFPFWDFNRSRERQAWQSELLCNAERLFSLDARLRRLLRSECRRGLCTGRAKVSQAVGDGDLTPVSLRRRNSVGEERGERWNIGWVVGEGSLPSASETGWGWVSLGLVSTRFSLTTGMGLTDLWARMKAWRWAIWLALWMSITGALPLRSALPSRALSCGLSGVCQTSLISEEWGRSVRKWLQLWHW